MHWRGTSMSAQESTGGAADPRALRPDYPSDLEIGARFFSVAMLALPIVIVGFLVITYMALAPLFGLPSVPAF